MVKHNIILRAREVAAEHGFERTPNEIKSNNNAIKALEAWSSKKHQVYLENINNRVIERLKYEVDIHNILEEEIGMKLSNKQVSAWLVILKIFTK